MNIQWYPGHMTKTRRMIAEQIKNVDAVCEILDARIPVSSRNPDVDELTAGKPRMVVLNRVDQADPEGTKRWAEHFRAKGYAVLESDAKSGVGTAKFAGAVRELLADKLRAYAEKGMTGRVVRVMILGIPNVGKSAILNRLIGEKRLKEGNKPGVTRGLTWVRLSPYLECMDSPGLLWPKIHDERTGAVIALIGSVRQEILDEEELAYYLIRLLSEVRPDLLRDRYGIEEIPEDAYEALQEICRKRGFLMRGGVADVERGCKTLLEEFRNGKLGTITFELPGEV